MRFRQNNAGRREQQEAFEAWRRRAFEELELSGLPATVFDTRDDWQYFLDNWYHELGNWNTPPFSERIADYQALTPEQRAAVERLRKSWQRECAVSPILARRI